MQRKPLVLIWTGVGLAETNKSLLKSSFSRISRSVDRFHTKGRANQARLFLIEIVISGDMKRIKRRNLKSAIEIKESSRQ